MRVKSGIEYSNGDYFYISLLLSPPFYLIWLARHEDAKSPSAWKVFFCIVASIPLAFFLWATTISFSYEGTNSLVWLFHVVNTAIVLSCFLGKKLWQMLFVLTIFTWGLYGFHMFLAGSPSYTDSPEGRVRSTNWRNASLKSQGKPLLPAVSFSPTWHTFLTHLYAVHPKS